LLERRWRNSRLAAGHGGLGGTGFADDFWCSRSGGLDRGWGSNRLGGDGGCGSRGLARWNFADALPFKAASPAAFFFVVVRRSC